MIIEYTSTTLRGAVDGANRLFVLAHVPDPATVMVFANGLFRDPARDNGWSFEGPQVVALTEPPQPGDTLAVCYELPVAATAPSVPVAITDGTTAIPVSYPVSVDGQTALTYGHLLGRLPDTGNAKILAPSISGALTYVTHPAA